MDDRRCQGSSRDWVAPDEGIKGWSEFHPGEVTVRLISRELQQIGEESNRRFGRGAGSGRTLSFRFQEGQWVFVGEGGWIS